MIVFLAVSACLKNNTTRLVYTSTYNTIFGGQKIENGDESLPYFPLDKVSGVTARRYLTLTWQTQGLFILKCKILSNCIQHRVIAFSCWSNWRPDHFEFDKNDRCHTGFINWLWLRIWKITDGDAKNGGKFCSVLILLFLGYHETTKNVF